MKDYHEQWLADRRAVSANIDAAVQDILREGYAAISEPVPAPYREHVKRANRDRLRILPSCE